MIVSKKVSGVTERGGFTVTINPLPTVRSNEVRYEKGHFFKIRCSFA